MSGEGLHIPVDADDKDLRRLSATLRQVKNMWGEIHAAIDAMPVRMPEATSTGIEVSDKCRAVGFSASKGVNAQSFHSARMLILVDEAIGIAQEMWDAIDGFKMSGDVRIATFCNPTVPQGPVFEDFTRLRSRPGHACITISAFDTPNLAGCTMESLLSMADDELEYAPFPMLTRRRAVVEMYHKWGPTNPRFQSRVLGEFPTQATDAVFHLEWIERASLPYEEANLIEDLRTNAHRAFIPVGLDIAGPGDDETSACARMGPYILAQAAWPKADPLDEVLLFLSRLMTRFPGVPIIVMADTVGVGYHFARAIARQRFDVREFIAGAAPIDPVMFANSKAEAYWRTRECLRDDLIRGITDEDCKAQLSDVRYRELMNGRIEIEHKDEARARGSSSPDRAEALVMAFHRIVPRAQTFTSPEIEQISPI